MYDMQLLIIVYTYPLYGNHFVYVFFVCVRRGKYATKPAGIGTSENIINIILWCV